MMKNGTVQPMLKKNKQALGMAVSFNFEVSAFESCENFPPLVLPVIATYNSFFDAGILF